jgi:uncharacterized protein (DUF1697 family)
MSRYVALLRGIGPATHGPMPLSELAARCAKAGFADVVTIGNTGNIVFHSERPQADVEAMVAEAVRHFGLSNEVFTRTGRQFAKLIAAAPFAEAARDHPGRVGVCFFHRDPHWPAAYLNYAGPERLQMLTNHMIIDYGNGNAVSRLMVERTVGEHMTQRNWSSILRIAVAMGVDQAHGQD